MRISCMVLFFLIALPLSAQNDIKRIWEPSITYTHRLNDLWSVTSQLAAFQSPDLLERVEGSVMGLRRISPRTSLGVGYLNRQITPLEDDTGVEHRFILQYGYQIPWGIHLISHRVRAEERIRESGNVHRFRYRISMRTPLQGERLDPGERYLLLQDEVLGSFSENPFTADNRISAHLGFLLKNRQRIEIGIQHRAERLFTDSDVVNVALLSTVWHFTN